MRTSWVSRAIVLGSRTIGWVLPGINQADAEIRVVSPRSDLYGWDCTVQRSCTPNVPAKDATHIAQVIGRMVRQPLVRHRIDPTTR